MPNSPVFIVGSPRSGTSVLVAALSKVGYQGYLEGNFLPLIMGIERRVDLFFNVVAKKNPKVLAAHIDPATLKAKIEDLFKQFTDDLNTGPLWFDKSGNHEMILAIPILRRLWPECVFIFAKRRAIENVVSRVKKFPRRSFEYHCQDWAKNMAAWREIRAGLPANNYIEVDQQDLIRNTDAISAKLSTFLALDTAQVGILARVFKSRRPQETAKGSAMQTYSLDSLGWSDAELEMFKVHCGAEMEAYGYGTGSEYKSRA
jgi:hypothetical protein